MKIKTSHNTILKVEFEYTEFHFNDEEFENQANAEYRDQSNFGKEFLCDEIRDELTDLNIESLALASIEDYCKQRIAVGCPQDVDNLKEKIIDLFNKIQK